jgi:hypothetical protein
MNKKTLNSIIIAVLLTSNLILLGFIFFSKPPHPPMPKQVIIKKLGLDKTQTADYLQLTKAHQEAVIALESKIKEKKKELYITLANANGNTNVDSLANAIGQIQTEIEHTHYKHFTEIKNLCRKEQLPAFNELSKELGDLFFRHRKKKK